MLKIVCVLRQGRNDMSISPAAFFIYTKYFKIKNKTDEKVNHCARCVCAMRLMQYCAKVY